jgi:dihydrodipicolinate synthase/N-acetylneuraminate lyase
MAGPTLDPTKQEALHRGLVIPAHPLALTEARRLDERHQRALTRYYVASGAGGLAVAVHSTQFAIREPTIGLHEPVLSLAAETAGEALARRGDGAEGSFVMVAGVLGATPQALAEAALARDCGYDVALLQLGALGDAEDDELISHCERVAEVMPLFGFYLQPAVGGRHLGASFWRRFAAIPNVVAIKVAPFDRYATIDVVQGVAASGRADEVALYTGNDDSIIVDLLTEFEAADEAQNQRALRFAGGLLGHWAVWTSVAVRTLERVRSVVDAGEAIPADLLRLAAQTTDANAAIFDPSNRFAGCIPGIHEVLRRQGLMAGRWTLDRDEGLSAGQARELDRIGAAYPQLNDDDFVMANLDEWLR